MPKHIVWTEESKALLRAEMEQGVDHKAAHKERHQELVNIIKPLLAEVCNVFNTTTNTRLCLYLPP